LLFLICFTVITSHVTPKYCELFVLFSTSVQSNHHSTHEYGTSVLFLFFVCFVLTTFNEGAYLI